MLDVGLLEEIHKHTERKREKLHIRNYIKIQTTADEAPWYNQVDPTMTLDKLLKLTEEFSRIYKMHGESLNIKKYAMRSSLRETAAPQNPNQPQQQSPQQPSLQQQRQGQSQVLPSIATLPPPPVAPQLNATMAAKGTEPARRIDLSDYKLRNNAAQQQQQPNSAQNPGAQTQRRNFMRPDVLPQTASKGLDLPLPPIIANEKQLNQSKTDAKSNETKVHLSKSGTSKPPEKPVIMDAPKLLQSSRRTNEQERHKKSKADDYDKDSKHKRIEKMSAEGSHHRKRPYENTVAVNQPDSSFATVGTSVSSVTSTPKSGTPRTVERHNPVTPLNHFTSGGYNTSSRSREEPALQSLKRDSNNANSNSKSREESMSSRQRDEVSALKRARQTAPLIALLPTPPASNTASVMSTNSQTSKYNTPTVQPSRSNHISGGSHRTNTSTNWSATNDHYVNSSSSNVSRPSQSSGSSNHRHHSLSNVGRTKSREPLLSTPDTGSSYYKRSRPRPPSPAAAASNTCRQSQRPPSPEGHSGSNYSTLPPPPLPPPNEELEDGEVL